MLEKTSFGADNREPPVREHNSVYRLVIARGDFLRLNEYRTVLSVQNTTK